MKKVLESIESAILNTVETEEGNFIEASVGGVAVYIVIGLPENFETEPDCEFDETHHLH